MLIRHRKSICSSSKSFQFYCWFHWIWSNRRGQKKHCGIWHSRRLIRTVWHKSHRLRTWIRKAFGRSHILWRNSGKCSQARWDCAPPSANEESSPSPSWPLRVSWYQPFISSWGCWSRQRYGVDKHAGRRAPHPPSIKEIGAWKVSPLSRSLWFRR